MVKGWQKGLGILLSVIFMFSSITIAVNAENTYGDSDAITEADNISVSDELSYEEYLKNINEEENYSAEEILLTGNNTLKIKNAEQKSEYKGKKNVVEIGQVASEITWEVNVSEDSFFFIKINYIPIEYKGKEISYSLKLNGSVPYKELGTLILPIRWVDSLDLEEELKTDAYGNDIIPEQEQKPEWSTVTVYESRGFYDEPLGIMLKAGKNTISFSTIGEPLVLESIVLYSPEKEKLLSYKEYYEEYSKKEQNTKNDFFKTIQAERPVAKTSPILYPTYDRSDPNLQPSSPSSIKRNIIGKGWENYGQYLEWEIEASESGFYRLAFKYRQSEKQESSSMRKLYVDGSIPFEEAKEIGFEYSRGYSVMTLGDKEEFFIYLDKGKHTIRLEVTLGDFSEIVRTLSQVQEKYSSIYRRIIMITSTSPDIYRDYDIEIEIPTLSDELREMADKLKSVQALLEGDGKYTADTKTLDEIIIQLESFVEKPYTIPERLSRFNSNNTTLSTYISSLQIQPLELDYIILSSKDSELPNAEANFFEKMLFEIKIFLSTFSNEYTSKSAQKKDNTIEVWLNSGREQLNVLTSLIDSSFKEKYDINVELKLIHCTLVQSILADMEPDIMVGISRNDPVDLALRGAIESLDEYDGFNEIKSEYNKEAFIPYILENKTYAIPETQTFNMMFYRTDIFEELGLSVPKTWDEFYNVSKMIIHKNMEVGLPYSNADFTGIFPTLVLQNGGEFFNETQTAMAFDSVQVIESFKTWTDFYTQLSFSLFKDDYNRFRTGEMPLSIMNYSFYNTLAVAAPEITGKWAMEVVPGTAKSDGSVDYTTTATGTAAMMMADSDKKDASWKFLKWWSSSEIQAEYGNRLEYILGASARYTPANMKAFEQIPWSNSERDIILEQWNYVREISNVPGSYYVTRNIDNAFRAVTMRNQNYREALNYWTSETNKEITRKRNQYGLN